VALSDDKAVFGRPVEYDIIAQQAELGRVDLPQVHTYTDGPGPPTASAPCWRCPTAVYIVPLLYHTIVFTPVETRHASAASSPRKLLTRDVIVVLYGSEFG